MTELRHRYDMLLIFDCKNGNPNGDPDAGNMPRVDPETLHGLVSDVCQKRKVRDWVYQTFSVGGAPADGYDIFFGHSGLPERQILNDQIEAAHRAVLTEDERVRLEQADDKKKEALQKDLAKKHVSDARAYLCRTRFDVRAFGAVLSTGLNAGQVRGAAQCTFARSVDPVLAIEATITRKSVARREEAEKQLEGDGSITGTMGRKSLIPYGLYTSQWFVNPMLAQQTGFESKDFKVLCDALLGMWETDRSASRGMMATRSLIVFEHASELGNARAHELFDRLRIVRRSNGAPPRDYTDYALELDGSGLPSGVRVFDLCRPEQYRELFA